ncbi:MAG: tRNA pseudouridine synthase A [Phycisphaerales bacterium]
MPRYKLTVAYDGTDFHGWQKQEPPDPSAPKPAPGHEPQRIQLRTVQHVLEQAVREVVREPLTLMGASRTDSGVHANGQVASFMSNPEPDKGVGWPAERGCDQLIRALNGRLPRDVLVRDACVVHDDFNPIGDAVEKEYCYTMVSGDTRPLWDRRMCSIPGTPWTPRRWPAPPGSWRASTTSRPSPRSPTGARPPSARSIPVLSRTPSPTRS